MNRSIELSEALLRCDEAIVNLSPVLCAEETPDPAPSGTKRVHYSPAHDGPFRCDCCPWFIALIPEQGEPPEHLQSIPHGRCQHPEVLQDEEMPWADAEETSKVVENGGCCEYQRPRITEASEMSDSPGTLTVFAGIPVVVENEAGSTRKGTGWKTVMANAYGYVRAPGLDGDSLDVFLGPDEAAKFVYIFRVRDDSGLEEKVMLGFDSEIEGKAALYANYDKSINVESLKVMGLVDFKSWIASMQTQMSDDGPKPIAFDFDGTLSKRIKYEKGHAGKPIWKVFAIIEEWRKRGYNPYVLTARTDTDFVHDFLKSEGLTIEVTNIKKPGTLAVVDDRAVDVENHDFESIMHQIKQKVALSEFRKAEPVRDTVTPFWDTPVHSTEKHIDFRSIQSSMLHQADKVASTLHGPMRVRVSREMARQAQNEMDAGKQPHGLSFVAPAEIRHTLATAIEGIYKEAYREARKETDRQITGHQSQMADPIDTARPPAPLPATQPEGLIARFTSKLTNLYANVLRDAIASDPDIDEDGLISELNDNVSDSRIDSIANMVSRETTRSGRYDSLSQDPRLANMVWRRSSVLEPGKTCAPCWNASGSEISGPDEDLSEIHEGPAETCLCLPYRMYEV